MTADQRSYNLDVKHKYFYMDRRSWRGACGLNWDGWHLPRLLSFLYVEFIVVLLWKQSSLLVWWKSLNWSNSESKGPADPECWDILINSWKYVAMWCHTLCVQPISRFLLMCVSKCENCIDCRAWEGFWGNCSDFTRLDEGFWCAWESTRDFSKIFGLRSGRDGFYGGQLSRQDWVQV